jgi:hypothetical protein
MRRLIALLLAASRMKAHPSVQPSVSGDIAMKIRIIAIGLLFVPGSIVLASPAAAKAAACCEALACCIGLSCCG